MLMSCTTNKVVQSGTMDVVPEVEGLKTLNASEGKIVYVLGEFGGLYKFSNKPKNPLEAHPSII